MLTLTEAARARAMRLLEDAGTPGGGLRVVALPGGGGGRVLAMDGRTGAVRRALPVPGVPLHPALAPAPDGLGWRLYGAEVAAGGAAEDRLRADPAYTADARWRPLALDPTALTPEVAWPLDGPAADLTVEAALQGDRSLFVEAVLADGAVTDPHRADCHRSRPALH